MPLFLLSDAKGLKKEKIKMIRLYRFMSLDEVDALMKGETITRNESYNGRTTARPTEVCFMTGNPIIYGYNTKSIETIDPVDSLGSLDGIVDTQALVEIVVPVSRTRWGAGYYADFMMEEVYLESYSSKDVTKVWKNETSLGYGFESKELNSFTESPKEKRVELFIKLRKK